MVDVVVDEVVDSVVEGVVSAAVSVVACQGFDQAVVLVDVMAGMRTRKNLIFLHFV